MEQYGILFSAVLFDLEVLMDHTLEKILARVQKPGRYVGGEYNAVMKNKDEVDCRFAFCFPDTYDYFLLGTL